MTPAAESILSLVGRDLGWRGSWVRVRGLSWSGGGLGESHAPDGGRVDGLDDEAGGGDVVGAPVVELVADAAEGPVLAAWGRAGADDVEVGAYG